MTLDEFMTEFEKYAKDTKWQRATDGAIRTDDNDVACPGCFLASKLGLNPTNETIQPGMTKLPMTTSDIGKVVHTADYNRGSGAFDIDLRSRLLTACGI